MHWFSLNEVSFALHGTLMLPDQHQCPAMVNRYLVAVLLACTLASSQTPAPDHWIAVRAGRLFDPRSDKLATNQVITIKGDKIVEVGPTDRVKIPEGAELIDLSEATVLPGLIDAHTHVFGNGPDLEAQILRDSYQYRTLTALASLYLDQKKLADVLHNRQASPFANLLQNVSTLSAADLRRITIFGLGIMPYIDPRNTKYRWLSDERLLRRSTGADGSPSGGFALSSPGSCTGADRARYGLDQVVCYLPISFQ